MLHPVGRFMTVNTVVNLLKPSKAYFTTRWSTKGNLSTSAAIVVKDTILKVALNFTSANTKVKVSVVSNARKRSDWSLH